MGDWIKSQRKEGPKINDQGSVVTWEGYPDQITSWMIGIVYLLGFLYSPKIEILTLCISLSYVRLIKSTIVGKCSLKIK